MYRGNKDKSSMNYFYEVANDKDLERMFYIIWPLIEDRIRELFPILLKEFQVDFCEQLSANI